jgi:hypothetical protein
MTKTQSNNFQGFLNNARIAGLEAVQALMQSGGCVPMTVSQHANPMDDNSPVTKAWFVPDGPCGFAWVKVVTSMKSFRGTNYNRSLNGQFANWLKAQAKTTGRRYNEILLPDKTAYNGGVDIWVSGFNQSIQKKETYAAAFAGALNAVGIVAYSDSRMD